jgi:hypothetical protein
VQPVPGGGNTRRARLPNCHNSRNAEEEACARELLELQQQQQQLQQQQLQQHFEIKLEDETLVDLNDNGVVAYATCSSPGAFVPKLGRLVADLIISGLFIEFDRRGDVIRHNPQK